MVHEDEARQVGGKETVEAGVKLRKVPVSGSSLWGG